MKRNAAESRMFCTICGKENFSIWRQSGKARSAGHLKKLWCYNCQKETNCCEVKEFTYYDYNDFLKEFNGNNFDEEGRRKKPYSEFLKEINE